MLKANLSFLPALPLINFFYNSHTAHIVALTYSYKFTNFTESVSNAGET